MIKTSGALTDKEKAEAEYWGIFGMAPAPELIEMTKFVSDTNDLRLDDDVKLFFVASNAIFDASIAAWDAKYFYDYVRPITAICALGDTLDKRMAPTLSIRSIGLFHAGREGRRRAFRRRSRGTWRGARSQLGALFAYAAIPLLCFGP